MYDIMHLPRICWLGCSSCSIRQMYGDTCGFRRRRACLDGRFGIIETRLWTVILKPHERLYIHTVVVLCYTAYLFELCEGSLKDASHCVRLDFTFLVRSSSVNWRPLNLHSHLASIGFWNRIAVSDTHHGSRCCDSSCPQPLFPLPVQPLQLPCLLPRLSRASRFWLSRLHHRDHSRRAPVPRVHGTCRRKWTHQALTGPDRNYERSVPGRCRVGHSIGELYHGRLGQESRNRVLLLLLVGGRCAAVWEP